MKNKKKKLKLNIAKGRIYIQATFNNSIISVTDDRGNVLASTSAGALGFKGARKSTLYAAQIAMQTILEKIKPYSINEVDIFVSGIGSGRDSAIRSLQGSGLTINSIKDKTPIPHNGCRPKKPRRV